MTWPPVQVNWVQVQIKVQELVKLIISKTVKYLAAGSLFIQMDQVVGHFPQYCNLCATFDLVDCLFFNSPIISWYSVALVVLFGNTKGVPSVNFRGKHFPYVPKWLPRPGWWWGGWCQRGGAWAEAASAWWGGANSSLLTAATSQSLVSGTDGTQIYFPFHPTPLFYP